ncbi:zinc ribbon domain-containing protein [Tautonia rosea]|uniref:hypothetical protein n=1 Tax=Tautonia rosea TaxID=2728037 RepID=UPI001475A248|nr:hypothetical protein [Tautonia rosea]
MTIDFTCPKCGAPFTVPESLAGKTGRCKKCQHQMTIPASKPVAAAQVAASGMFRLSGPRTAGAGYVGGGRPGLTSDVGLAPLTEEVRPVFGKGAPPQKKQYSFNPDLLLENSVPGSSYKLVASHKVLPTVGRESAGARTPGALERFWRSQSRAVLRVVRQFSDLVYLLTVPCVILILVAIVLDRRDLAVLGATGVIVLSLLRLVLEGFALVAGPFKENPLQGILFLIPPFTFIYLSKYPKRTKKALGRVLAPMGWILGVILAFAFIPQLSSGEGAEGGSTLDRARAEVGALKGDVTSELEGQGVSLDAVRNSETGQRAREALGELKSRARDGLDQAKQALPQQGAPPSEPNP